MFLRASTTCIDGDNGVDESWRSRFEIDKGSASAQATATGRLAEHELNPAVCDMAVH
jgi:hypothetical protein